MPLLDAALAFALTMFAVASVVTVAVRVLRTNASARHQELRRFLEKFFTTELKPAIESQLNRLTKEPEESVRHAIQAGVSELAGSAKLKGSIDDLTKDATGVKGTELTTRELLEWLRRTDLGKSVTSELQEDGEALFARLGERYEAFGEQFTMSFRRNARKWATGVAIVLAVLLNIDSIDVLTAYMKADESQALVLARQELILQQYQVSLGSQTGPQPGPGAEQIAAEFDLLRQDLATLRAGGFPVGWQRFPMCRHDTADARCAAGYAGFDRVWVTFVWLLGCLLTGLLAGLGAPFWHDVVTGITHSAQIMRGGRRRTGAELEVGATK